MNKENENILNLVQFDDEEEKNDSILGFLEREKALV